MTSFTHSIYCFIIILFSFNVKIFLQVLNLYPDKIIWSNQNKAPVLAYHSVKHPNQSFPILNQLIGFVPSLNQYVSGGMWDLGAIKNSSVALATIEKDTILEINRLNGMNPCCCYWFIWWWCTWVYSKPVFLMNVCIHLSVSGSLLYGIKLYLSWQKCCCFSYEKKNYIFQKQKSIVWRGTIKYTIYQIEDRRCEKEHR